MKRRVVAVACALLVTLLVVRWRSGPDPFAPHPDPSTYADCNDWQPPRQDPGMIPVSFDVTSGHHEGGDTAFVHACIAIDVAVDVSVDGDGVLVSPTSFVATRNGRPQPIRLTVAPRGHGVIRLHGQGRGLGFEVEGPAVVTDGPGWHVEPRWR